MHAATVRVRHAGVCALANATSVTSGFYRTAQADHVTSLTVHAQTRREADVAGTCRGGCHAGYLELTRIDNHHVEHLTVTLGLHGTVMEQQGRVKTYETIGILEAGP
eukprot:5763152-Heterocapsa_arctica.AAC.1